MLKLTETTRIRVPIQEKRYIRFERHSRAHWRSNNSQLLLGGYSGQQTSIIGRDVFSGVRVTRSLVLYVCFVDRFLYFFFWPLRCLLFFDIRFLIAPLVSSNSSLIISK
jgi:hypothetical protein